MEDQPVTQYAKAPDGVSIAYQVTGGGPQDLVFFPGLARPLDLLGEDPGFVRFRKRLAAFSRTIWCEVRGTGASGGNFLDNFAEGVSDADVTALLDASGCEQVVPVAAANSGAVAISYAALHPDRVSALVLIATYAHYVREDDYTCGLTRDELERYDADIREQWGTGMTLGLLGMLAPSKAGDEAFLAWYARSQRLGSSPEEVAAAVRAAFVRDVRHLLPTISVPTLVVHRTGDRYIRADAGRYLAEQIPGAKYVELPGEDHLFFVGDTDAFVDEIQEFLTGGRQAPEGDLVTSTILFTDIVSSTEQSARMGHRKWTSLTDDHDAMVRATLHRHRGHEVKTIGDGFLATFDATTRAIRAAVEIVTACKGMGLDVRAGVHAGEVEVRPDDVVGLTVSIAKRICDVAGAGQVFVSEAVKALLVGSGMAASDQGTHVLKGVPDEWRLYAVET